MLRTQPVGVIVAGDLVLDEPDASHWLSGISAAVRAADLAIAHLEVPHTDCTAELAGDVPAPGAPPANLPPITEAGFGLVSLARNHIADCGAQGMADTVAGLAPFHPEAVNVFMGRIDFAADGATGIAIMPVSVEPPGRPVLADGERAATIRRRLEAITVRAGLPPIRVDENRREYEAGAC